MSRIVKYVEVQRITSMNLRELRNAMPEVYATLIERVLLNILDEIGQQTTLLPIDK